LAAGNGFLSSSGPLGEPHQRPASECARPERIVPGLHDWSVKVRSQLELRTLRAIPIAALLLGATSARAVDVDLRSVGASGSINGATFEQMAQQPTGTGVIDPFLRVQSNVEEQGFNTDHSPLNGDLADVKAGAWTHSVRVSDLTTVMYSSVLSVQLLLDVNQTSADPQISLDELRIFTAATPDISDEATLFAQNEVYNMGAGNRVLLDYSLNSGSGSGDMYCYLPASLFIGLGGQYFYLYCKFGASGGSFATNDGFEEWAQIISVLPVESRAWSEVKGFYRR
jgi:hypothetical protein